MRYPVRHVRRSPVQVGSEERRMSDAGGSGQEGVLAVVGLEHEQHDGWLAVVVEFSPATGEIPAVGPEAFGHALWGGCASLELEEVCAALSPVLQQERGVRVNYVALPFVSVGYG